jgi:hypothetical protein
MGLWRVASRKRGPAVVGSALSIFGASFAVAYGASQGRHGADDQGAGVRLTAGAATPNGRWLFLSRLRHDSPVSLSSIFNQLGTRNLAR